MTKDWLSFSHPCRQDIVTSSSFAIRAGLPKKSTTCSKSTTLHSVFMIFAANGLPGKSLRTLPTYACMAAQGRIFRIVSTEDFEGMGGTDSRMAKQTQSHIRLFQ